MDFEGHDVAERRARYNCPAMPDSLVESELFGHVKGAFTGATENRPGCFELADGGTLFLDEVADLSASAQASLLRVLETRTLRRIGSSREITVQIRVIAATNAPLEDLVERREFRTDLYYRLNVFTIHLQQEMLPKPPCSANRNGPFGQSRELFWIRLAPRETAEQR